MLQRSTSVGCVAREKNSRFVLRVASIKLCQRVFVFSVWTVPPMVERDSLVNISIPPEQSCQIELIYIYVLYIYMLHRHAVLCCFINILIAHVNLLSDAEPRRLGRALHTSAWKAAGHLRFHEVVRAELGRFMKARHVHLFHWQMTSAAAKRSLMFSPYLPLEASETKWKAKLKKPCVHVAQMSNETLEWEATKPSAQKAILTQR